MAKTIFVTERAERHQQHALQAAPESLAVTMLREPERETLQAALLDAVYLISERRGAIDADLLHAAPELKLVLRLGSQTDDIDLDAAREQGVAVAYWPQPSTIRVAEQTIMQILGLLRRINETQRVALDASPEWGQSRRTDENTFSYNWSGRTNLGSLWRKSVGLLGFGEIGMEVARRLRGWDCALLYNKRSRLPAEVERDLGIHYAAPERILAESDVVVNLLPYSSATDRFINQERIAAMKHNAILVSTGSGSVIDESALAEAIRARRLAGAALDTYEYEPLRPHNPLRLAAQDGFNVVLTPHTAAVGDTPAEQEIREQYSNILRHMAGESLLFRLV